MAASADLAYGVSIGRGGRGVFAPERRSGRPGSPWAGAAACARTTPSRSVNAANTVKHAPTERASFQCERSRQMHSECLLGAPPNSGVRSVLSTQMKYRHSELQTPRSFSFLCHILLTTNPADRRYVTLIGWVAWERTLLSWAPGKLVTLSLTSFLNWKYSRSFDVTSFHPLQPCRFDQFPNERAKTRVASSVIASS